MTSGVLIYPATQKVRTCYWSTHSLYLLKQENIVGPTFVGRLHAEMMFDNPANEAYINHDQSSLCNYYKTILQRKWKIQKDYPFQLHI